MICIWNCKKSGLVVFARLILTIFIFLISFFISSIGTYFLVENGHWFEKKIYFNFKDTPAGPFEVFVDDLLVIQEGLDLYPQTGNIMRPLRVKIKIPAHNVEDIYEIKLNSLRRDQVIPFEIQFADKKEMYGLHVLPKNFPNVKMYKFVPIDDGYIFISFHGLLLKDPSYATVFDTNGNLIYYRGNKKINESMFHLQKWKTPSGKVRYSIHAQEGTPPVDSFIGGAHYVLDEDFNVIDVVRVLKSDNHPALPADEHEFVLLDDGHYIVLGYKPTDIKFPNGRVSHAYAGIVQERKDNKVIFEWDGSHYSDIIDACQIECPQWMNKNADFMHVNSIQVDPRDNNLIISMANTYSVVKVDRSSGKILWQLGGKNDEFGLTQNQKFHRQHDAQMLPDGRLILFDNRYNLKEYARVLIFNLDEQNKRVQSFKEISSEALIPFMGSVQILPDENLFIGCGRSYSCAAKLINPKGEAYFQMTVNRPYTTYRAYFFPTLD